MPRKRVQAKGKLRRRQLQQAIQPGDKVRIIYNRAGTTPSARLPRLPALQLRTPKPSSALAAYVEENRESGISIPELIWQFQEYDCEHESVTQVITSNLKIATLCETCGRIEVKVKSG